MLKLKEYQKDAVKKGIYCLRKYNCYGLFLEQRLGKTPISAILLLNLIRKPGINLIVVPSGKQLDWQYEIKRWANLDSTIILKGKDFEKGILEEKDGKIYIISYDLLTLNSGYFKHKQNTIIIDESHFIKNRNAKRSKVVRSLSRRVFKYRIALTGTPVHNCINEIWSILNFLRPLVYTSFWKFAGHFFQMVEQRTGFNTSVKKITDFISYNYEELIHTLDNFCIRKRQSDITEFDKVKMDAHFVYVEPTKQQIAWTNRFIREKHIYTPDKQLISQFIKGSSLVIFGEMLKLSSLPENYGIEGSKFKWINDHIKKNPTKNIIIFSKSTPYLQKLAKLHDCILIVGGLSHKEKQRRVDSFRNGDKRLLFANLESLKVGYTLPEGDEIIFNELPFNPTDYEQAKNRIFPTLDYEGSDYKDIYTLILNVPFEKRLFDNFNNKKKLQHRINNFDEFLV